MNFLYTTSQSSFEERLETPHLLLRPYEEGDEQEFLQLVHENTKALNPAFSARVVSIRVLEDARIQLAQLRTDWDNRKQFDFGVWQKENNTYIGNITLKNIERNVPKAEVALYFTHWPDTMVLAQEALTAVIGFAFKSLKLNRIYIRCTQVNMCYAALAESCGFVKEGVLRSDFRGVDSEELLDLSYYGMIREDYEQATQQLKESSSEEVV
jgi:RimJ/RimL family protein N-acetyltransferase